MRKLSTRMFMGPVLIVAIIFTCSVEVFSKDFYKNVPDKEVEERLDYIVTALEKERTWAAVWWYGWIAGYGALAITQGCLSLAKDDPEWKQDMIIGSVTAAIGLVGKVIDPFIPAYAFKHGEDLKNMPTETPEQIRAKLERAERLFRVCAARERNGWEWHNHLLAFLVNFAAGVVTCAAFDRPLEDGMTTFAIGFLISEIDIFTSPIRLVGKYRRYSEKYKQEGVHARYSEERNWFLTVKFNGFAAGVRF